MNPLSDLIPQPDRSVKPRTSGVTMVLDNGIGLRELQDLVESAEAHFDYVKFGWGTSLVHAQLTDKVALLRNAGIGRCVGGTLFELAFVHGRVHDFFNELTRFGFDHLEISDGTVEIPSAEKLDLIRQASDDFVVYSEYGSKIAEQIEAPRRWVEGIQAELAAGARKVIAEGRESGTAGLYRGSSELRGGLVDELMIDIKPDDIIWEAPLKAHQTWFIKKFGANVNLGNIAPSQVVAVETLRRGLRSDTLQHFHVD